MLPVIVFFVVLIAVIAWCMGYLGGFPAILKKMNDRSNNDVNIKKFLEKCTLAQNRCNLTEK